MNRSTPEAMNGVFRSKMARVLVAGSLMLGACTGGGGEDSPEASPTAVTSPETINAEVCGEIDLQMGISFDAAYENAGSPESILPMLTEAEGEERSFMEANQAADTIMEEACQNPYTLAVLKAFVLDPSGKADESGRIYLPENKTIERVNELTRQYQTNPESAVAALEDLASVIAVDGGLRHTSEFAVTEGQATSVSRFEDGSASGFEFKRLTVDGLLEGYQFNFNTDSSDLTAEQRAQLELLSSIILVSGDGRLIINTWIGEGQVTLEVEDTDTTVPASPQNDGTAATSPTSSPSGSQTQTTTGGGGTSGNQGGGEDQGGAPGGDGPGCDGVGTGCEGEGPGGPGGPGEGEPTPTTQPEPTPTTQPEPTPTTQPEPTPTTQPEPTPTTQPEEDKGEEPGPDCENNPYDPQC